MVEELGALRVRGPVNCQSTSSGDFIREMSERDSECVGSLADGEPGRVCLRAFDPSECGDGNAGVVRDRLLRACLALSESSERAGKVGVGATGERQRMVRVQLPSRDAPGLARHPTVMTQEPRQPMTVARAIQRASSRARTRSRSVSSSGSDTRTASKPGRVQPLAQGPGSAARSSSRRGMGSPRSRRSRPQWIGGCWSVTPRRRQRALRPRRGADLRAGSDPRRGR
jgi:hypothetical protein